MLRPRIPTHADSCYAHAPNQIVVSSLSFGVGRVMRNGSPRSCKKLCFFGEAKWGRYKRGWSVFVFLDGMASFMNQSFLFKTRKRTNPFYTDPIWPLRSFGSPPATPPACATVSFQEFNLAKNGPAPGRFRTSKGTLRFRDWLAPLV